MKEVKSARKKRLEFEKRLIAYSAVATVATIGFSPSVEAVIQHRTTPLVMDDATTPWDIDGLVGDEFLFDFWTSTSTSSSTTPTYYGIRIYNNTTTLTTTSSGSGAGMVSTNTYSIKRLNPYFVVGPTLSTYSFMSTTGTVTDSGSVASGLVGGPPTYIGFRFVDNISSVMRYGWAEVTVTPKYIEIHQWAWEDTGASIMVGDSINAPTSQASALSFANMSAAQMDVSWTAGSGANRIVVVKEGAAVDWIPTNGTDYAADADTDFSAAVDQGSGNKVVYDGSGTSLVLTGLTAEITYYIKIFEYNGTGAEPAFMKYIGGVPPTASQATAASLPATDASALSFANTTTTQMEVSWTSGDGANRIVVVKEGAAVDWSPTNGTDYAADADFSAAVDQGSGNKVVYNGVGTSLVLAGLTADTTYYVKVFEYNGTGALITYTAGTPPEANQATAVNPPATDATALSFVNTMTTQTDVSWTAGDGANRIVVAKEGAEVDWSPTDGIDYVAVADFSAAVDQGSGNRVVYNGAGTSFVLTGLTAETTYNFAVFEYNGTGTGIKYTAGTPLEASQATIANLLVSTLLASSALNATDLYWTPSPGAIGYKVYVSLDGGSTYAAPVDVGNVTSYRVEGTAAGTSYTFKVTVYDAVPNESSGKILDVVAGSDATLSKDVIGGTEVKDYVMISFPLVPNQALVTQLGDILGIYDPVMWRIFRYNPSSGVYDEHDSLESLKPGLAYWLISRADVTLSFQGYSTMVMDSYPVELEPGWNQIANPFQQTVPWADVNVYDGETAVNVLDAGNTLTGHTLWAHSVIESEIEYVSSSTLIPCEGYWVKNLSSQMVFLEIPSPLLLKSDGNSHTETLEAAHADEEKPPAPPGVFGTVLSGSGGGGCFISAASPF